MAPMYYSYIKSRKNNIISYQCVKKVSLLGCNRGEIPKFLINKINSNNIPVPKVEEEVPFLWEINIEEALKNEKREENTIIIDLMPKNEDRISLFELCSVYGFTNKRWSSMLYHLKGLFVDEENKNIDKNKFEIDESDIDNPYFTINYVHRGYVENGKLIERWSPSSPGSNNSALLEPDALDFFCQSALKVNKGIEK
ncbi:MAG: hypothetical protein OEV94_02240 [Deltaproteobacteria bacterium]|nr:hypothetical protein [Deltaproteobacteria bacterium]